MKTASGTKFGKTEAGTVWLDAGRTSPFKFYQFWLNTDDSDVIMHLKCFTFLDQPTIDALDDVTKRAPERREAQRVLAREVTTLVHGVENVTRAEHASSVLFGEGIATLSADHSACRICRTCRRAVFQRRHLRAPEWRSWTCLRILP